MLTRSLLALILLATTSCVPYQMFDKVQWSNMAPRLSYQGFSFDRPPHVLWYFRQSEQFHTDVTLRRDLFPPSDTHTFYARVALGKITRKPQSLEEFASLAQMPQQQADYEVRDLSYSQSTVSRQNQWCIRFESSHSIIDAPSTPNRELAMRLGGYRCLHPTWPKTTLDFFWSERGLPHELDPDLVEEGEEFLDGVRIDVAPNTPAA